MVKRINTWQDALTRGKAVIDVGDGIEIELPTSSNFGGAAGAPGAGVPAGGAALQVIRKDAAGITTEWATPDKTMVGLSNVNNTTDMDKPVSTPMQAALNAATFVKSVRLEAGKWVWDLTGATHYLIPDHTGALIARPTPRPTPDVTPSFTW